MTAVLPTLENIKALKRGLLREFPDVGSSRLTEALAAALGHGTHASLLAECENEALEFDIRVLDENAFCERTLRLGYADARRKFPAGFFSRLGIPEDGNVLIKTTPPSAPAIKYNSDRSRAWRNLLVATINCALERRLFSLKPGDNRWPGCEIDPQSGRSKSGVVFNFVFDGSEPAIGWVDNAGFDEMSIHCAVWPTVDCKKWIAASNAGFLAGDAFAAGWLERRGGAWLQSSTTLLRVRRNKISRIAGPQMPAKGYGDRGHVIL